MTTRKLSCFARRAFVLSLCLLSCIMLSMPLTRLAAEPATSETSGISSPVPVGEGPAPVDELVRGELAHFTEAEIRSWAKGLELDASLSLPRLKAAILSYYGLSKTPAKDAAANAAADSDSAADVNSENTDDGEALADDLEFLKGRPAAGDKSPVIKTKSTAIKIIHADEGSFDENEKSLVLRGGVTVQMEVGGSPITITAGALQYEYALRHLWLWDKVQVKGGDDATFANFSGSSCTIYVQEETSVLYDVMTSQDEVTLRGEEVFLFGTDRFILSKGGVSTEPHEEPHYSIKGNRISILGDGDWYLENGFLYLGRVPMVWLPAYMHPGRSFFFHPRIGYSNDLGGFVQTTSYLLGGGKGGALYAESSSRSRSSNEDKKEKGIQSLFDFQKASTKYKLSGIYLDPVIDELASKKDVQNDTQKDDLDRDDNGYKPRSSLGAQMQWTLMADLYAHGQSLLGTQFTRTSPNEWLEKAQASLSILVGYRLYPHADAYTALSPNAKRYLQESYLGGYALPFRYYGRLNLEGTKPFRFKVDLPIASDPRIYRSYIASRKAESTIEEMLFKGLKNKSGKGEDTDKKKDDRIRPYIELSYRPKLPKYVDKFELKELIIDSTWRSKTLPKHETPDIASAVADEAYYPDTSVLPKWRLTVGGELFSTRHDPKAFPKAAKHSSPQAKLFRSLEPKAEQAETPAVTIIAEAPADGEASIAAADKPELNNLKLHELGLAKDAKYKRGALKEWDYRYGTPLPLFPTTQRAWYSGKFLGSYTFNHAVDVFKRKEQRFYLKHTNLNYEVGLDLFYELKAWEFLTFSPYVKTGQTYKLHSYRHDKVDDRTWKRLLEEDKRGTGNFIAIGQQLVISPPEGSWSKSKLGYKIEWEPVRTRKDREEKQGFVKDRVNYHEAWLNTIYDYDKLELAFETKYILPPRTQKLSLLARAKTKTLDIKTETSYHFAEAAEPADPSLPGSSAKPGKKAYWDPILFKLVWQPIDWIKAEESIQFDIDKDIKKPDHKSVSTLMLGRKDYYLKQRLDANIKKGSIEAYEISTQLWPLHADLRFKRVANELKLSSLLATVKQSYKLGPFWKGRIELELKPELELLWNFRHAVRSSFMYGFSSKLKIFEFLDLELAFHGQNKNIYAYTKLGGGVNFFKDLADSSVFASVAQRQASNFKMKDVKLELTHHMESWKLKFSYNAEVKYDSSKGYYWEPRFMFAVNWEPIEALKLKTDIKKDKDGSYNITVDED